MSITLHIMITFTFLDTVFRNLYKWFRKRKCLWYPFHIPKQSSLEIQSIIIILLEKKDIFIFKMVVMCKDMLVTKTCSPFSFSILLFCLLVLFFDFRYPLSSFILPLFHHAITISVFFELQRKQNGFYSMKAWDVFHLWFRCL